MMMKAGATARGPVAVGRVNAAPAAPAAMTQQQQPVGEPVSAGPEEYLGMVKSYNERRGFGFVACEQTALRFGRDVYIAKAEAQLAMTAESGQQALGLAEEDLILFRVRLSVEGYPQAEQIKRVRKFIGTVMQPPPLDASQDAAVVGRVVSDELLPALGAREALLKRAHCGQSRFSVGDRVTFCVQGAGGAPPGAGGAPIEALLVMLATVPNQRIGSVLSCFGLTLPRAPVAEGWPMRPDLHLNCHALGDRVILSGLPPDADQDELMRFFKKHGATGATIAHSKGASFASVGFSSTTEVVRFVARSIHTFADDKETRLARLHSQNFGDAHPASLPGLPAPMLTPGEEAGILLVTWSPVLLATGYQVELRPAGVQAPWSVVDASEGRLGSEQAGRFGNDASCCRVTGLPPNVVFEARVKYFTSCGCCSDASDSSEWCQAFPAPPPVLAQFAGQAAGPMAGVPEGAGIKFMWPQANKVMAPPMAPYMPVSGWRCMHGAVIPPPSTPEIRAADEQGYALLVQWPSVAHASAYVVELRESGSTHTERFIRNVPPQAVGSVVELCIGGLRPAGGPGRCYLAQVRSIGGCGCESEPSPQGMSPPVGAVSAPALPMQQVPAISLAEHCPPPSSACSCSDPSPAQAAGGSKVAASMGKAGLVLQAPPNYTGTTTNTSDELPNLLGSRMAPPVPPPSGPAPSMMPMQKEIAPEVAGNEEDCIILD